MKRKIEVREGEQLYIIGGTIAKFGECDADTLKREHDAIPISPARTYDFAVGDKIDIFAMRRAIAGIKGSYNLIWWALGEDGKADPETMHSIGY